MRCPYCKGQMEKRIDYLPLSRKRRQIVDAVVDAGPAGIDTTALIKRFFPHNKSDVVVRTTIHYINNLIKPLKIVTKAGKIRFTER